ncbi:MAG: ubiquinone biosynthesis hydroxylase [Bauldia sp.]|nr:ubiquinone biosynthesis hydroxylase [Bauldia sp.]
MIDQQGDIVIAGGGPVGLTLAAALVQAAPGLAVTLVDDRRPGTRDDGRASAISAGGKRMLERLGVWNAVADSAQPVHDMIVTDSRVRDVVRPVFLTFDGTLDDGEPFAHMVPNAVLTPALLAAAEAGGAVVLAPETVSAFATGEGRIEVSLGGGPMRAALLVAADGVRSRLRDLAGIRTLQWDYGQVGLVATVAHERPHNGRAEEHFLPSGPFATLPLKGNRSSLVWTETKADADRLMAADDATFAAELARRFGHHLGALAVEGKRHAYPLALRLARDFVRPRFALVGDAAHSIHPLAGQGLNLGLRDVAALAETIVEARRLGLDIGALDVLERYQAWRRFDTLEMGAITDGLNRLFSNDSRILRGVRDIGLGLVDRVPFLKRAMISQAAGIDSGAPRLLRGEAI